MSLLVDANPHATIIEFLDWPISVKDKFYFIRHYTELTLKERQSLSLLYAKVSLDIYEKKYPNDKRVRECVEAIEAFNSGNITRDELMNKRAAAAYDDAYAAAYAAAEKTHTRRLLDAVKQWCNEQVDNDIKSN